MDLLSLPYDVRYQIYQHIFPSTEQIYIEATSSRLKSISREQKVPTALLLTCRAINAEASEYLYSSYLFNIVGRKSDCLKAYKRFLGAVEKYARNTVHVDAFSNGSHSATMCMSIQVGEGRMKILRNRERGERKGIAELESEVKLAKDRRSLWTGQMYAFVESRYSTWLIACCALLTVLLAWILQS